MLFQQANACDDEVLCTDTNEWQLGIALGIGGRSNPLVDGDTIPLVVLPDIAWYGEKAYFDNGELGYQWHDEGVIAFETFATIDRERAFFSFWHPSNFFVPRLGLMVDTPSFLPEDVSINQAPVSIDDIASRDWAFNAGARAHYRQDEGELTLSWQTDISNTHKGNIVTLAYQYNFRISDWRVNIKPSATWKSANIIDYYYGISLRDGLGPGALYSGRAGWQPAISITATRPISEKWQWLLHGSYQRLHSGMTDSPIVDQNKVVTFFSGVGYRF